MIKAWILTCTGIGLLMQRDCSLLPAALHNFPNRVLGVREHAGQKEGSAGVGRMVAAEVNMQTRGKALHEQKHLSLTQGLVRIQP